MFGFFKKSGKAGASSKPQPDEPLVPPEAPPPPRESRPLRRWTLPESHPLRRPGSPKAPEVPAPKAETPPCPGDPGPNGSRQGFRAPAASSAEAFPACSVAARSTRSCSSSSHPAHGRLRHRGDPAPHRSIARRWKDRLGPPTSCSTLSDGLANMLAPLEEPLDVSTTSPS